MSDINVNVNPPNTTTVRVGQENAIKVVSSNIGRDGTQGFQGTQGSQGISGEFVGQGVQGTQGRQGSNNIS